MGKLNGKSSKFVKKSLAAALSMAMVVTSLTVASTDAGAKTKGAVKSVKVTSPAVNGGKLVLKKGQKAQLKYTVTVTKGASKKVAVTSSNKKVAKVIKKGSKYYVKAVAKKGNAKITVASKANAKKKAVLKVAVGTPVKKVVSASVTETKTNQDATYLAQLKKEGKLTLAKATAQSQTVTKKTTKASSKAIEIYTAYTDKSTPGEEDKCTDYDEHKRQVSYAYKLSVTTSPAKATYKAMKWKSSKTSLVTVDASGNIIVRATKDLAKTEDYTLGTCTLTGTTKDGSNKTVKVKIKVVAKANIEAPKVYENEIRTPVVVEDFESYDEGYNWESDDMVGNAGKATKGKSYVNSNCGTMTVVKDPEDPTNKVLKIDYTGDTQAYDYAPIFNFKLPQAMGKYSGVQAQTRVVSNGADADCTYKTLYAYFAPKGKITPEYYFATTWTQTDSATDEDIELHKFDVNAPMAVGSPTKYNIKEGLPYAGMVYQNKYLPTYFSSWSTSKIDINRTVGYKESETDANVGWHQNTLNYDMTNINNIDSSVLTSKNVSMVLGSTFAGNYSDGAHVTVYIDNIAFMEGDVLCTDVDINIPTTELVEGTTAKLNADLDITYTPENTTQKSLIWTSSNEDVVKVDTSSGTKIVGVAPGTATITATIDGNDAISKSFEITVTAREYATSDYTVDLSKLLPVKAEDDTTTKIYSSITATVSNGKLTLPITQNNNDFIVIDLGEGGVDLSKYKSISITGTTSTQMGFEIYPDGADITLDNWWYLQYVFRTDPFFGGSCLNRTFEGTNWGGAGEETIQTNLSEATLRVSLKHARYIMLKTSNYIKGATYEISSIKFCTDEYVNNRPTDAEVGAK